MTDAQPMAEVWRGDVLESRHRGHAVVCDARGAVRAAWGDPDAVILPRSSCKMLQALPLLESGAGAGLGAEQLALACASHNGAAAHVTRVARWLAELGLSEADLRCGPQVPEDAPERQRLRAAGAVAGQLHNNCSGKHAGFLMLAQRLGAGPEYVELDHPVQRAVRAAFEEMCGAAEPGLGDRRLLGAELRHHGARAGAGDGAHGRSARARAGARGGGAAAGRGDGGASDPGGRRGARLLGADAGDGRPGGGEDRGRGGLRRDPARAGPRGGAEDRGRRDPAPASARSSRILARLGAIDPRDPAAARRLTPPVLSRRGAARRRDPARPGVLGGGRGALTRRRCRPCRPGDSGVSHRP